MSQASLCSFCCQSTSTGIQIHWRIWLFVGQHRIGQVYEL